MTARAPRRADALSKRRVVEAATKILDNDGQDALTFRALASLLSTGAGAIYHHVANKNELLAAATDAVIVDVTADVTAADDPRQAIRSLALGLFDAIDARPWVGAQLAREPWQFAMLQIFESVGTQLHSMGVPDSALFDCGSAVVNYILGVAGQNAANARLLPPTVNRSDFLASIAVQWTRHDPAQYPFVHRVAGQLRDHDDREQFLAGIDLILAGIAAMVVNRSRAETPNC